MSDNNIDYDELDKAVNAAINARTTQKAQPKAAASARPVAKRPVSRGTMMDFAPRKVHKVQHAAPRRIIVPKPAPVEKEPTPILAKKSSVKKPVAAPINRLVKRPAVKSVTKTVARPTVAPVRQVSKPAMRPAAPAAHPVHHAATPMRPAPHVAAKPTTAHPALRPAAKPAAPKPTVSRVEQRTPIAKPTPETAPAPAIRRKETPNANNYSLGGRSPFLMANAKVEKRPLGAHVQSTSASALRSTKNVYSQKSPTRNAENAKKHIIAQNPKQTSGWLWALIVLAVIIAGAALGYLAYLIVFAH